MVSRVDSISLRVRQPFKIIEVYQDFGNELGEQVEIPIEPSVEELIGSKKKE